MVETMTDEKHGFGRGEKTVIGGTTDEYRRVVRYSQVNRVAYSVVLLCLERLSYNTVNDFMEQTKDLAETGLRTLRGHLGSELTEDEVRLFRQRVTWYREHSEKVLSAAGAARLEKMSEKQLIIEKNMNPEDKMPKTSTVLAPDVVKAIGTLARQTVHKAVHATTYDTVEELQDRMDLPYEDEAVPLLSQALGHEPGREELSYFRAALLRHANAVFETVPLVLNRKQTKPAAMWIAENYNGSPAKAWLMLARKAGIDPDRAPGGETLTTVVDLVTSEAGEPLRNLHSTVLLLHREYLRSIDESAWEAQGRRLR